MSEGNTLESRSSKENGAESFRILNIEISNLYLT
jgi:hypothetical protein